MTETVVDERDLAKALNGVTSAASGLDDSMTNNNSGIPDLSTMSLDTSAAPTLNTVFPQITPVHDSNDHAPSPVPPSDSPVLSPVVTPSPALDDTPVVVPPVGANDVSDTTSPLAPVDAGPLADIKKDALNELRPLVDKLSISPEEKFDTYLLLIRSTDDRDLIGPAHEAAKAIQDESRKAEALLEIIKEIDYLSRQNGSNEEK